jgi:hypothetical protein
MKLDLATLTPATPGMMIILEYLYSMAWVKLRYAWLPAALNLSLIGG